MARTRVGRAEVNGKPLVCLVCGHDQFRQREVQMNTSGLSFLNLDWLNRSAKAAVCEQCGFVHQFA